MFAISFFQIPHHGGYLAIGYTISLLEFVRDLHPVEYTHAEHTRKVPSETVRPVNFAAGTLASGLERPSMGKNFRLLDIAGNYTGNGLLGEKYKPMVWRFSIGMQGTVDGEQAAYIISIIRPSAFTNVSGKRITTA